MSEQQPTARAARRPTRRVKSGVYILRNKITGDTYIGSSANMRKRWGLHRGVVRGPLIFGYGAGMDAFRAAFPTPEVMEFEVLEYIEIPPRPEGNTDNAQSEWGRRVRQALRPREQEWMERLRPTINRRRAVPQEEV